MKNWIRPLQANPLLKKIGLGQRRIKFGKVYERGCRCSVDKVVEILRK